MGGGGTHSAPATRGAATRHASEDDFPLCAGRWCLAEVMESLTTPDAKRYPAIVDLLVRARALDQTAVTEPRRHTEIVRLREAYRRRRLTVGHGPCRIALLTPR